jgi:hypothetical protein
MLIGFCGVYSELQGATSPEISIEQAVQIIAQSTPSKIIGFEKLPEGRDSIPASAFAASAENKLDVSQALKVISSNTDYECIVDEESILIVPKLNPSLHDTPLSSRMVSFPDAKAISLLDFLGTLKGQSDPDRDVFISLNVVPLRGRINDGKITLAAGHEKASCILNKIARQLNARYWMLGYMYMLDSAGKAKLPLKLNVGLVTFFSLNPGESK